MSHITNTISQLFGKFANTKFPKPIQSFINNMYVCSLKLNMSEFKNPDEYESLNALFTRELVQKRPIKSAQNELISPSDSLISEQGRISDATALQIKGFEYSVKALLCLHESIEKGTFINLYLSPRDYHRFHAPCDMRVKRALHVPGKLYPVNFRYLKKVPSLFCKNERVILECESVNSEKFYMVFVGALNVGKISFTFDENIQTNASVGESKEYVYDELLLKKGDEIGTFEMGSTVVLIFENEEIELLRGNEKVRFTEPIASF